VLALASACLDSPFCCHHLSAITAALAGIFGHRAKTHRPLQLPRLTGTPAAPASAALAGGSPPPDPNQQLTGNFLKVWALLVLSATYVHQASTGYSIPIMLPMISTSLSLSDFQVSSLPVRQD